MGTCVRQVIIAAPGPHAGGDAGAVLVAGDHRVDLVNLRVSGEQIGVRVTASGAVVTLRGVWIHQATRYGVLADVGTKVFNGEQVEGKVMGFSPYTITVQSSSGDAETTLRKLAIAYYRRLVEDDGEEG